jgi:hypothetical protein
MLKQLDKKHTQTKYIRSTNKKTQVKKKKSIGGGIMNLVIREEKDTRTTLPFGLSKFNPASYFKSTRINPNMYRVVYNYRSPNQIDLTLKQNQVIKSSNVISKPHIFPPNMNHYLISLIEHPGKSNSRLIWLSSYKNRSWEHDILSYMPPSPKPGQTRAYALIVYKYPLDVRVDQIYKPIDMTTAKRKEEFSNFQTYLAANKMIQLIPNFTKYFKVQYDSGNALSFLSNVLGGKTKTKNGSVRQDKLAFRQAPQKI